jgi:hypothetical protein
VEFLRNEATANGGALSFGDKSHANLMNATVLGNVAQNGAGIYASGATCVGLQYCLFANNNAAINGDLWYMSDSTTMLGVHGLHCSGGGGCRSGKQTSYVAHGRLNLSFVSDSNQINALDSSDGTSNAHIAALDATTSTALGCWSASALAPI